jgi:hypothetical protein
MIFRTETDCSIMWGRHLESAMRACFVRKTVCPTRNAEQLQLMVNGENTFLTATLRYVLP